MWGSRRWAIATYTVTNGPDATRPNGGPRSQVVALVVVALCLVAGVGGRNSASAECAHGGYSNETQEDDDEQINYPDVWVRRLLDRPG